MPKRDSELEHIKQDLAFLRGVVDESAGHSDSSLEDDFDYQQGREFARNYSTGDSTAENAKQWLEVLEQQSRRIIDSN